MCYYARKADLKGVTGVDTSNLAAKSDLDSLKAEVDIDKINICQTVLGKLSNVVDIVVVKKTV